MSARSAARGRKQGTGDPAAGHQSSPTSGTAAGAPEHPRHTATTRRSPRSVVAAVARQRLQIDATRLRPGGADDFRVSVKGIIRDRTGFIRWCTTGPRHTRCAPREADGGKREAITSDTVVSRDVNDPSPCHEKEVRAFDRPMADGSSGMHRFFSRAPTDDGPKAAASRSAHPDTLGSPARQSFPRRSPAAFC